MLDTLVSSKTKVKLLLKFFLNSSNTAYLRNLESEFEESTNAIRIELNKFEESGLLNSQFQSNKKIFRANTSHPLFPEINSIIRKYVGIDKILDSIISRLGVPDKVWLTGKLARGLDDQYIDLVIQGNVDTEYLDTLVEKVEKLINKRVRVRLAERHLHDPFQGTNEPHMLLWSKD